MQIGTIFQIAALLGLLEFHQQANKSITLLGIAEDILNRVKKENSTEWEPHRSEEEGGPLIPHFFFTSNICPL
jgi:hypothetical protein